MPADTLSIYHNPSCSKSRETLALIQASGIKPRVVEYLKTPPRETELTAIVRKLGIAPAELVRRNEPVFREKYDGKVMDDAWSTEAGPTLILPRAYLSTTTDEVWPALA